MNRIVVSGHLTQDVAYSEVGKTPVEVEADDDLKF